MLFVLVCNIFIWKLSFLLLTSEWVYLRLQFTKSSFNVICCICLLYNNTTWTLVKFLLEDSPVNSFNCYMNLKKENKKQMWCKKLDVMMRCMKLALFMLFHATFFFCLLVFHLPWKALPLIRFNDYSAPYVCKNQLLISCPAL